MTMQDELYRKINSYKIKNEIKKILNYYLIDTSHFEVEIREGNPKPILIINTWAGPKRGLGYIAREITRILKQNGINEVGKIILQYEFLKRKKQMAINNLGEKLGEKLKKPEK